MKIFIEAYDKDGRQRLGNMDGQGVIWTRNYKRTKAYRRIANESRFKLSLYGAVREYRFVDESGRVLETIVKGDS